MSSHPEQESSAVPPIQAELSLPEVAEHRTPAPAGAPARSSARSAVLLDPFPLWLDAVEHVLRRIEFHVVGKTTSPSQALALVETSECDLLVAEIKTRETELDGLACIRRARERVPHLKAIVLSLHGTPEYIDAAFEAGASAYVLKTAEAEDFATTVRQSFEQTIYLEGGRARVAPPPPLAPFGGVRGSNSARARDPAAGGRGPQERRDGDHAVAHRTDNQVPPLEHLPEAERGEPDRGEPVGAGSRPAPSDVVSGVVLRTRNRRSYAAVGVPNQVVSASTSPGWVGSPTQATYPSGRINTAVGAVTAPSAGSSHVPLYVAWIS